MANDGSRRIQVRSQNRSQYLGIAIQPNSRLFPTPFSKVFQITRIRPNQHETDSRTLLGLMLDKIKDSLKSGMHNYV